MVENKIVAPKVSDDTPEVNKRKHRFAPTALLTPGMIWLGLFFLIPLISLFQKSLSSKKTRFGEPVFSWEWSNYSKAFSSYGEQFQRSFVYAGIATLVALLLAFPLAYVIAFRGGRWKNFWMGLVMVPFSPTF